MLILSRFWEKVCAMAEGGSHYCSKKTDDICGGACDEVFYVLFSLQLQLNS